ncbi:HNH endonuclease [Agrobacterium phage Atu_ph07]|uniref:Homing endonuclease n=1 Tax=Agrobacterium phage Atu_ph07 TaxID=2024264 RepID=A0A2L0V0A0_9CAUD|nr:HNH endonuclease [Agrobacterium phage Atu_ph07]AUZ95224.1 homing endonuclease [Agrobacterium phage Atu_ph07]
MTKKLTPAECGKLGAIATKKYIDQQNEQKLLAYDLSPTLCKNCSIKLEYAKRHNKFCGSSCSASYNNVLKTKKVSKQCKHCNSSIKSKAIYCSLKCQHAYEWSVKKENFINGLFEEYGHKVIKKLIIDIKGYKCDGCNITEWKNAPIVLELEHKDGISSNNHIDNVCLLCPNCHSQTPTYKGRNKGNGRHIRRERYRDGKSY